MNDLVKKIMYASWGCEQTNVDFYQIVRETPSSIWLQEIDQIKCEGTLPGGTLSSLSGFCRPLINTPKKSPMFMLRKDGFPESRDYISPKSHYKLYRLWDGKPQQYSSYA
jgi:hypothetical protein